MKPGIHPPKRGWGSETWRRSVTEVVFGYLPHYSMHPNNQAGQASLVGLTAQGGHADAEARRSVLTALPCATLVT